MLRQRDNVLPVVGSEYHGRYCIPMEKDEPVEPETRRLQLQQAIESLRHQQTLVVQMFGFLFTADALLLAYALTQRAAGILLAASLMPLGILVAIWRLQEQAIPYAYVAMYLERHLVPDRITLAATSLRTRHPVVYNRLEAALRMDDAKQQDREVRKAALSYTGLFEHRSSWVLLAVFMLQLTIFVIALAIFNYRFA